MKNQKPVLLLVGVLAFVSASLVTYDKFWGFDDGLIRGIAFKKVLLILGAFFLLMVALGRAVKSPSKRIQNCALFAISMLFCLLMVEGIAWFSIRFGIIESEKPRHHLLTDNASKTAERRPFWGDYNPHFAKWYLPLDTLKRENCAGDSLFSFTNSFGARDRERTDRASSKRVVLLGDSFIEGFMVNTEQRMSDLLEKATGIEHLNFGINGTSPINYYLTYQHLVKSFDHEVLLIGILPGNDFEDFTAAKKSSLVADPIYRPYWEGVYPNYSLRYSLASIDQSWHSLGAFNAPEKMPAVIDSIFCSLSFADKMKAAIDDNSYTWRMVQAFSKKLKRPAPDGFTRFNTYSEEEWNIFSYSLEQLFSQAENKKIVLLVLPILQDLYAYEQTGENRLTGALESLIKDKPNIGIIDFLPIIHKEKKGMWEELFVLCDGHWSVTGEKFASEIVLNHPVYRAALGDTTQRQAF